MTDSQSKQSGGPEIRRRTALAALSTLGLGTATFRRALAQEAAATPTIDAAMIANAEWIAEIDLTDDQRKMAAKALRNAMDGFAKLRAHPVQHGDAPSFIFKPLEDEGKLAGPVKPTPVHFSESATGAKPQSDDDLSWLPVSELSALMKQREISSTQLTEIYLRRLKQFDPLLKCVVNLTEETAMAQAARADRELAAGHYRGPLHGIPWGAKDLIAWPGYPTTWGAPLNRNQQIDETAAVAQRLEAAGCVLAAKLTLGSYAMGDQWYGGKTRNPWNPFQGSSGSSAGSASAVVAGLVGFTIGSETMGSITSPSRRCGATGLRPTFGRVSRYGCMTLSWTLDKLGPICRSVEDCAVVFGAIHGQDHRDSSTVDRPFDWPARRRMETIRVGYLAESKDEFKTELDVLKGLGVQLVPIEIPENPLARMLSIILTAECSSVFDELTRRQEPKGVKYWPTTFAMGQFILANDYIRAHRVRRQLMEEMKSVMRSVDVIFGPSMMNTTNMTGHPQIVLPNGFREPENSQPKTPTSVTFTGRLYDETTMMAVADAYQKATGHHLNRPPIDDFVGRVDDFNAESDRLDEERLYD